MLTFCWDSMTSNISEINHRIIKMRSWSGSISNQSNICIIITEYIFIDYRSFKYPIILSDPAQAFIVMQIYLPYYLGKVDVSSFHAVLMVSYSILPRKDTLVGFIGEMSLGLYITLCVKHSERNIAAMKQVISDVFKTVNLRLIRMDLNFIGFTSDEHHILKVQVLRRAFSLRCVI